MSKQKSKYQLARHLHFHLGVYLALATLLITAAKSSSELIRTAYALPTHYEGIHDLQLREAEILHGHITVAIARKPGIASE